MLACLQARQVDSLELLLQQPGFSSDRQQALTCEAFVSYAGAPSACIPGLVLMWDVSWRDMGQPAGKLPAAVCDAHVSKAVYLLLAVSPLRCTAVPLRSRKPSMPCCSFEAAAEDCLAWGLRGGLTMPRTTGASISTWPMKYTDLHNASVGHRSRICTASCTSEALILDE